jgi:RNA-binding protein YhbY
MKLTKAEKRILEQAKNGHIIVGTGNNGATRKVVVSLNKRGLLQGHVLTAYGQQVLDETK